jgi:hypothetical protein
VSKIAIHRPGYTYSNHSDGHLCNYIMCSGAHVGSTSGQLWTGRFRLGPHVRLVIAFGLVCAFGLVADMAPLAPPVVEVCPILKGGMLKRPVVPSLKFEDGRHWIELAKENTCMTCFLTGQCFSKRPLMNTTVIKQLGASRNVACKASVGDEGVDGLGLDDAVPSPRKRRKSDDVCGEPGPFVVLEYDCKASSLSDGGAVWEPHVLRGSSNMTVFLEFTTENMAVLFQEVRHDIAQLDSSLSDDDDSGEQEAKVEQVKSGVKGVRWISQRSVWDLRWVDARGKQRCKTWKVAKGLSPLEAATAREEARLDAVRFRGTLCAQGLLK